MSKNEDGFYVSNVRLYQEYVDWYASIQAARDVGVKEPPIPAYIVESMMKIANRLTYKPNFINYTFKDDMVSDALYDCVRFAQKFNISKSENPFSYITTICFYAFLRRIDKEKTHTYIKAKLVTDGPMNEFFSQENTDDAEYKNMYVEFLREVGNSDDCLPMSMKRAAKLKEKNTSGPLDAFN